MRRSRGELGALRRLAPAGRGEHRQTIEVVAEARRHGAHVEGGCFLLVTFRLASASAQRIVNRLGELGDLGVPRAALPLCPAVRFDAVFVAMRRLEDRACTAMRVSRGS